MKLSRKVFVMLLAVWVSVAVAGYTSSAAAAKKASKPAKTTETAVNASFDVNKMSNMSGYDPANVVIPTGDTIKIAIVASFSGPAAINAQIYWAPIMWAVYDINKRGGIMVDGKKKLIEVIKADHMSKADQCKKVVERMILQEKVHILWGTDGSNMMKIINETANKYKVIAVNGAAVSDDLQDAVNFGRYSFQTTFSTEMQGRALAYYYGQIRKKETKFYILNQDYGFGRLLADGFKKGLKEYHPTAQLVGEDYHKLFLTDFAPYLTKIKASGAEVIFTGDWMPDAGNLLKQARQMGITIPFANVYMDEPNMLHEVGIQGTKGLVHVDGYDQASPVFKTPEQIKYYKAWSNQWSTKWKTPPFNGRLFALGTGGIGAYAQQTYWLLSVIERAGSTNADKIVKVWEGDTFRYANGKVVTMRPCDHKTIMDLSVTEFVTPEEQKVSFNIPPYHWYEGTSYTGPAVTIPAAKVLPWMDQKLDRCKGKSDWGK